jgi:hypothetical protein
MFKRLGMGGAGAALLALALLVTGVGFTMGPQDADSYTWSAWRTRYYTATAAECKAAKRVIAAIGGPVQYYTPEKSCIYRVRQRYANIDNLVGWRDRIVQQENSAAIAPVWGMKLQVRVHWNGKSVFAEQASLICNNWGVIVKTTEKECKTIDGTVNGVDAVTARMSYDASFVWTDFGFNVRRGAQETVLATGGIGMVVKWP